MYPYIKHIENVCVCLLLWVASCAINTAHAGQAWVADEIFLQMAELRKEIKQLQDKVSDLERQAAGQPVKADPIPLAGTGNTALGKADAAIAIVEFSDYECPYCAKHNATVLPKLLESYIDKGLVQYIVKDFPLEFHAHAKRAALSARCAGEQGKFRAMHDAIFEARGQVSDEWLDTVIKQQKLAGAAFKHCLENPNTLVAIEQDRVLGLRVGINGTPAFLIGTVKNRQLTDYQRLSGAQPLEAFATIIKSLNKP